MACQQSTSVSVRFYGLLFVSGGLLKAEKALPPLHLESCMGVLGVLLAGIFESPVVFLRSVHRENEYISPRPLQLM